MTILRQRQLGLARLVGKLEKESRTSQETAIRLSLSLGDVVVRLSEIRSVKNNRATLTMYTERRCHCHRKILLRESRLHTRRRGRAYDSCFRDAGGIQCRRDEKYKVSPS